MLTMRICKYHTSGPYLFTGFENKLVIRTVQIKCDDFKRVFGLLLPMLLYVSVGFSQQSDISNRMTESQNDPQHYRNGGVFINDSMQVSILSPVCKNSVLFIFYKKPFSVPVAALHKDLEHNSLLQIHGNVLYNFSYRSYIDTPFAQNNLIQNLIQTNVSFLVKNKYPVKMTISNRNSNSPYFKNVTDVNIGYSRRDLLENIKENLKKNIQTKEDISSLKTREQLYRAHKSEAEQLQSWINAPARNQEIIEEKERSLNSNSLNHPAKPGLFAINNKVPAVSDFTEAEKSFFTMKEKKGAGRNIWESLKSKSIDSAKRLLNDTTQILLAQSKPKDSSCLEKINVKKKQLADLLKELNTEAANLKHSKKLIQDSINQVKQQINGLRNSSDLYAFMKQNGLSKDSLSKAQKILLAIDEIGIGRTFIDYSELTVKNISLTGINIEANPGNLYFAAAAGKIDYLFRDFILKSDYSIPDQSLYLLRAGIGKKEKNNFIVSFYNGKKSVLNSSAANNSSSLQKVLGISLESRLALNANNYIIAEVAKSSFNNAGIQPSSSDLFKRAMDLNIHTNEAYSIKLFSQNPATDTKVTGYYKKMGENFQSFNLYPVNVNEASWMIRANQYFWKHKISIDAAVRKNDFLSSLAIPSTFTTKTIFKSIQASLRIRKFPFISVGYYPASQLSLTDNNILTESQYNTLNAVVSYSYQLNKTSMNTNALFTRFYNNSSDTGFIYYNASSYTINHSIFLNSFTLQSEFQAIDQKDLDMLSLSQSVSYQIKNAVSIMAGLKWNKVSRIKNLFGAMAAMNIYLKSIGTIQFNYDKSFLPGYNRTLKPVDIGRMTFYRDF